MLLVHQKSADSLSEASSTASRDDSISSNEEIIPEPTYSLWDWPLNENGLVRAVEGPERFCVNLDFSYLQKEMKDIEVINSDTVFYKMAALPFSQNR